MHKHKWEKDVLGYGGYWCRCGAWADTKNPIGNEVCIYNGDRESKESEDQVQNGNK